MKRVILASAVIFLISVGYIGYNSIRNHGHNKNNSHNSIRNNDYISIRDHQEWIDSYFGLVDIDVTLSSIPMLNEAVTVIATFTVIKYLRDHEPTDEARISLPRGLQFVGGDSIWVGKLENGVIVTLQAQIKPVKPGKYVVGGSVYYYEVPFHHLSDKLKGLRNRGGGFFIVLNMA